MGVIQSASKMHAEMNFIHSKGKTIGFVPTMGALHKGHFTLIEEALKVTDIVVCSIFVNPLQFNNPLDFEKYPSTIDKDTQLLKEIGCHVLFHPNYEQVYGKSMPKEYNLENLNNTMEGAFRPGHFQGVANVVIRLFEITQPTMAFFGLKDYQQYMVIKTVSAQVLPNIKIIGVNTIRDKNGLALSSRNLRLNIAEYESAIKVPALLKQIGCMLQSNSVAQIKKWFKEEVNKTPHLKYEYLELANADTLEIINELSANEPIRCFTAFYANEVRLIDNMPV